MDKKRLRPPGAHHSTELFSFDKLGGSHCPGCIIVLLHYSLQANTPIDLSFTAFLLFNTFIYWLFSVDTGS